MGELNLEILKNLIDELPPEAKMGTTLVLPNLDCEACEVMGVFWPSPENPHEHDTKRRDRLEATE